MSQLFWNLLIGMNWQECAVKFDGLLFFCVGMSRHCDLPPYFKWTTKSERFVYQVNVCKSCNDIQCTYDT